MSTSDLKLNLMERLALVQDAGFLQRLKQIFDMELGVDEDFTEEDLAELDRRRAEYLRGDGTSYTAEESLQRLRSGKR